MTKTTKERIDVSEDWANIEPLLETIKDASIRVMGKPATTQRMGWILETIGISNAQFKNWSGLSLGEWKRMNPDWNEQSWTYLICENIYLIKEY